MERIWFIIIAVIVFIILSFLFYKAMNGYVRNTFGKKWVKMWGNKVYFWQSLIFMSLAGTVVVMYLLKWSNVLTF